MGKCLSEVKKFQIWLKLWYAITGARLCALWGWTSDTRWSAIAERPRCRVSRGAGSKLKVGGHEFRREAPEKNFFCAPPPHFSAVPTQFGGTAHTRVGTKMGSHSPLFVLKEMAKESSFYSDISFMTIDDNGRELPPARALKW